MGATWYWQTRSRFTANEAAFYDRCLVGQHGNTVACDAMMRVLLRAKN